MDSDLSEDFNSHQPRTSVLVQERATTPQSWGMLAILMAFTVSYGFNVLYIQPIASSMKIAFNVTDNNLSILLTVGSLSSALFFLGCVWFIVMKGVRISCSIGLAIMTLGTILEIFIDQNFYLIYIGHFITHSGSSVFGIANAKYCSIWFNPKNRPLAMTLNAMSGSVGLMIAFIVPGFFVSPDPTTSPETLKKQIRNFHFFLAGLYGTLFLVSVFLMKEAPKNYVTYKDEEAFIRKNFNMMKQVFELCKQPTYILLILCIGFGVSSVVINQLLLVQLMDPFQINQANCQVGGALMILGGLISSVGYSKLLIHYPNQLRKIKLVYLNLILIYTFYCYLPHFKKLWLFYVGCFTLGFFGMIQVAIVLESMVKYIIITGPQRLVVGSGLGALILSFSNGVFTFFLKGFIQEGTTEGVYKFNAVIIACIFGTFVLATILQVSFEKAVKRIMNPEDAFSKDSVLLKAVKKDDTFKSNKLVDSLLKTE